MLKNMRSQKELRKLFNIHFNYNKNICTPTVIKYVDKDTIIIEVSSGRALNYNTIYGVTALTCSANNTTKHIINDTISGCYDSLKDVEKVLQNIHND